MTTDVNDPWPERLSEHNPISVDLPLEEPENVEPINRRRLLPGLKWPD